MGVSRRSRSAGVYFHRRHAAFAGPAAEKRAEGEDMSSPYVGEIRMGGWNFAPSGWMLCEGQLLPISQYEVLFNLIGTIYGGDGVNTFALPDLRGRLPIHQGSGAGNFLTIGQLGGEEEITLTTAQIPAHTHALQVQSAQGSSPGPGGAVPAASALEEYSTAAGANAMAPVLASAGSSLPHDNMPPFLAVTFVISLFGIFPSQS